MARSRRKTPILGFCSHTDKPFMIVEHRRERRTVKIALRVITVEELRAALATCGHASGCGTLR